MDVVKDRLTVSEAHGYGVAFVSLGAVTWRQWCALSDLNAGAVAASQGVPNGSPEAHRVITAGGWNLIAPWQAFNSLVGAAGRIVG